MTEASYAYSCRGAGSLSAARPAGKGAVKEQWGKLTDNDVQEINGRREILVGKLQTRYGMSHDDAERQVGGFEGKYRP